MINMITKNRIFKGIGLIIINNSFNFSKCNLSHSSKMLLNKSSLNIYKNSFSFTSSKNNGKQNKQEKTKKHTAPQQNNNNKTAQDQQLTQIREQFINKISGYSKDHSFKNDLIIAQQNYKKNIKQLKQAILFEDLLKKQIDILIYDTQGKPYLNHILKTLISMIFFVLIYYLAIKGIQANKKFNLLIHKTPEGRAIIVIAKILTGIILFKILFRHLRMNKRYVEKIVYHTENQTFSFVRRKFYGAKYEEKVSRFKILYTQNEGLNKRGTNYLNIENHHEYSIGYEFAWKKQDLFSHLISQRIRK